MKVTLGELRQLFECNKLEKPYVELVRIRRTSKDHHKNNI